MVVVALPIVVGAAGVTLVVQLDRVAQAKNPARARKQFNLVFMILFGWIGACLLNQHTRHRLQVQCRNIAFSVTR